MSARLQVEHIGPSVGIQDLGRQGYQRFGVATSGAVDTLSFCAANALIGNPRQTAALELAGYGGRFRVTEGEPVVGFVGGVFDLKINGDSLPWQCSYGLRAGDVVDIGAARQGHYGYMAVTGGVQVPEVLGSRATHLRAAFGGVDGRNLMQGDRIETGSRSLSEFCAQRFHPVATSRARLRVLAGPQWSRFAPEQQAAFLANIYTISIKRDRMGIQLDGPSLEHLRGYDVLSEGVALGSIQITGSGKPIVLMADRQPTGGYPKIATVVTADLARLAQLPSGESVGFELVTQAEALQAYRAYQQQLNRLSDAIHPLLRDPKDLPDLLSYQLVDGVIRGDETDEA